MKVVMCISTELTTHRSCTAQDRCPTAPWAVLLLGRLEKAGHACGSGARPLFARSGKYRLNEHSMAVLSAGDSCSLVTTCDSQSTNFAAVVDLTFDLTPCNSDCC